MGAFFAERARGRATRWQQRKSTQPTGWPSREWVVPIGAVGRAGSGGIKATLPSPAILRPIVRRHRGSHLAPRHASTAVRPAHTSPCSPAFSLYRRYRADGGIAPNAAGRVAPFAASMTTASDARRHRTVRLRPQQ
eukprot:scaffold22806_cov91-Isochrysis_galbana.AAC.3